MHLPEQQNVYFQPGLEMEALQAAAVRNTTLTAWFDLNAKNTEARKYLYQEIPTRFVFERNKWKMREQRGHLVTGRMHNASPVETEKFHLRLLLLFVRGATSFTDLRTHNNVVYGTFKEAAAAGNLLRSDEEWQLCLQEAAMSKMPKQLRRLFATICAFCQPSNAKTLFETFEASMVEDFRLKNSKVLSHDLCLQEIDEFLHLQGLSCEELGLPHTTPACVSEDFLDRDAEKDLGAAALLKLNYDQQHVVEVILDSIAKPAKANVFFLDGPGGTGKTYVYSTLMHILRGRGLPVIPVAWTGIAATLLQGGRTVHSRFKLPLALMENSVANVKPASAEAQELRNASLILWDEAPMAPATAFECIDRLLRDITKTHKPFGGKVILLGGDFRQVLPVIPRASRTELVSSSIKHSYLWRHVKILKLTQNMRAGVAENRFAAWLVELGDGKLPIYDQISSSTIEIPEDAVAQTDIISEIYGSSVQLSDVGKSFLGFFSANTSAYILPT